MASSCIRERADRKRRQKAAKTTEPEPQVMGKAEQKGLGGDISRRTFVGGALVASSGLAARAQTEMPAPKRGGILKVSTYLNPSRLDPYTGNSAVDQTVMWTMFDTLVDYDQN